MNKSPKNCITLKTISELKEERLKEIHKQRDIITKTIKATSLPFDFITNKGSSIFKAANISILFFNGIITGIRTIRKIRKIFHKRAF